MKFKWKRMQTLAAAGLALILPLTGYVSYAAGEWDATRTCSLTVNAVDSKNQDTGFVTDLETADVVIDLYRVASAVKTDGHDNFSYELLPGYETLYDDAGAKTIKKDLTPDEWRVKAQKAAQIALGEGSSLEPAVTEAAAGTKISKDKQGNDLYAGLYLMVARGKDVEDYIIPVSRDGEDTGEIGTVAWSADKVYTFEPELVALPGVLTGRDLPRGETNSYAWNYDVTVNLKPEQSERFGYLDIAKSLLRYKSPEPAVFVFQVEAELNGKQVYGDVLTVEVNGLGPVKLPKPLKLPAGAKVTVTEVYGSPWYTLVRQPETMPQTVTSEHTEEKPLTLEFVSDYNGRLTGGKIITNRFTYSGTDSEWKVEQIGDLKKPESGTEVE